jgi:hypothetical protein
MRDARGQVGESAMILLREVKGQKVKPNRTALGLFFETMDAGCTNNSRHLEFHRDNLKAC